MELQKLHWSYRWVVAIAITFAGFKVVEAFFGSFFTFVMYLGFCLIPVVLIGSALGLVKGSNGTAASPAESVSIWKNFLDNTAAALKMAAMEQIKKAVETKVA